MALINECPKCGSKKIKSSRQHKWAGVLGFLFLFIGWFVWLALAPREYACLSCGAKWA